jgi:hypothetical protein
LLKVTYKNCGCCGKIINTGIIVIVKLEGFNIKQHYHKECFDMEAKEKS